MAVDFLIYESSGDEEEYGDEILKMFDKESHMLLKDF